MGLPLSGSEMASEMNFIGFSHQAHEAVGSGPADDTGGTHLGRSNKLPRFFSLVNREQDLGSEGMRQAKMTYRPCGFVQKYAGKTAS
jgi:hypothetical protein